jgi:arabinogalactan endo-1,4-beta-galactosidase
MYRRFSYTWNIKFINMRHSLLCFLLFLSATLSAQKFYFGSDLSYVNEMEDCGAVYRENNQIKDVYEIFADHKTNLARFRLWHAPSFYDTLNAGKRYSDFQDVRRSILRAKAAGMDVLLDFHLSDFWADPSRQLMPKAWEPVAGNLTALQDSVYQYVHGVLMRLHNDQLLPELVQIGNETNKGIVLTPAADAANGPINWSRNAALFNKGIQAVRDVETATGKKIRIALHIANPKDTEWLMPAFWNNGVRDFDIIGLSYYWAWHKPVTIAQTGEIISKLKNDYPGKSVMIFETGYIWTQQSNDQAANIITETHPDYHPASPQSQRNWLVDLTQEVINRGGEAVMYWEPAWVSTPCYTPWGQGSHQEHAAFFGFSNNAMLNGGITWPEHRFEGLPEEAPDTRTLEARFPAGGSAIELELSGWNGADTVAIAVFDSLGRRVTERSISLSNGEATASIDWKSVATGIYFVRAAQGNHKAVKKLWIP